MDLTHGINVHQEVAGMVADYNKREAKADADALKECAGVPYAEMEPSKEGTYLVRKGRVNPFTGAEISPTSKTRSVQRKQFGPVSPEYAKGYDGIKWD